MEYKASTNYVITKSIRSIYKEKTEVQC